MTPTPYSNVFKRFEGMITDFDLDGLVVANKEAIEIRLLNDACASFLTTTEDLSRDDTLKTFLGELSEQSEMVVANFMIQGWCKPYVNSQELFETHFSTSEYKQYSQSEKMAQIRNLMEYAKGEASSMGVKVSVKSVMGRLC
jgi:hypothetical protein